jgi:hypothetical protein
MMAVVNGTSQTSEHIIEGKNMSTGNSKSQLMINHIVWQIFLLAGLMACSAADSQPSGFQRGSEELNRFLALGPGSTRPAPLETNAALKLGAADIHDLAIDPAAETWGWVSFDTSLTSPIPRDASLEEWTRSYVASHEKALGLAPHELATFDRTSYEPSPGLRMITYTRSVEGRPVKGAFVQFIFVSSADGYRLREILNNSFGPMKLSALAPSASTPSEAIALTGIDILEPQGSHSVIQPLLTADGLYEFRYATEHILKDPESSEILTLTVDDATQAILEGYSNRFQAAHTLSADVYTRSYVFKDQKPRPLAFVTAVDAMNNTVETDINGVLDTNSTQLTLRLGNAKSYADIYNAAANANAIYSFPMTLGANGKTTLALTNADPAALNVYMSLHEITEHARKFLNPADAPLLRGGIRATVNINDSCNAFYTNSTVNFFSQGTPEGGRTCANTGLVNDIVYHEWGHALDDQLGVQQGIRDGAFSEGIGDITAFTLTGSPEGGPGFFLNNATTGRTAQNARTHPPRNQQEAEVHSAGMIISGAFWDLRNNLLALYGATEGPKLLNQYFFQHLKMADRYIDSYQSILRLDDNDQNPATRSPHYCLINKAFARHALTGGLTEGATCVDTDTSLKVRVDLDEGGGQLTLVASAFGADSIVLCTGQVTSCAQGSPSYLQLSQINEGNPLYLNSSRRFYEAKGKVTVKADETYTLMSVDAKGQTMALRALQFKSRDRSGDLSQTLK